MPIFEYKGTNGEGLAVQGNVISGSLAQAADELARQGIQLSHLAAAIGIGDPLYENQGAPSRPAPPPTEPRAAFQTQIAGPLVGRVAHKQLLFFFRQLATMLHAGVPVVQTLDTLSGQTEDPRLAAVVREMKGHALEGRPISAGLQRYPEIFSPLILSLIRVGETGGSLVEACRNVADYLEREIELRNLIKRVTAYPKLVLGASIVIVLATNFILGSLGKSGGLSTPLTTLSTWICLAPLLIGLVLFYRVGLQNPRIRHNYEKMQLSVPYIGTTIRQLAMARFGRAFGALYSGGVPPPEALKLAADACGNEYMRGQLHPLHRRLEEGEPLAATFASAGVFSPIVLDMVRTGETSGSVDQMLTKMSEFYEDEAKVRSVQAAYALGIFALLVVGAYVGYVAFTFYSGFAGGFSDALNAANGE